MTSYQVDVPVDEAAYITMYLTPEKRKLRMYDPDCNLTIITKGDGTKAGYKESIDYINNFKKHEKTMNPPKTRIQESELNGHKIEIVLREYGKESFELSTYLYCKNVLFFLHLQQTSRAILHARIFIQSR